MNVNEPLRWITLILISHKFQLVSSPFRPLYSDLSTPSWVRNPPSPGCRVAVKVLCTLMCNGGWSEAGIESTKKKKKKTCKLPDVSSGRCLAWNLDFIFHNKTFIIEMQSLLKVVLKILCGKSKWFVLDMWLCVPFCPFQDGSSPEKTSSLSKLL